MKSTLQLSLKIGKTFCKSFILFSEFIFNLIKFSNDIQFNFIIPLVIYNFNLFTLLFLFSLICKDISE